MGSSLHKCDENHREIDQFCWLKTFTFKRDSVQFFSVTNSVLKWKQTTGSCICQCQMVYYRKTITLLCCIEHNIWLPLYYWFSVPTLSVISINMNINITYEKTFLYTFPDDQGLNRMFLLMH